MNKKKGLALLCVLSLCVSALAFSSNLPTRGQTPGTDQDQPALPPGTKGSPSPARAPEHVVYAQFFRHLTALKGRAAEVERQGRSGKALRSHYKDKVGLDDNQARTLDEIAADYARDTDRLDAQAKRIIDAAHARYRNGVVPQGEQLPTPPPELKRLQRQKEMRVMRARHRLREALGEHGFKQIDDFLKLNIAPNVKPAQPQPREAFQPQHGPAGAGR